MTPRCCARLQAEIVSLCFNNEGDKIITGATRAPKPPLLPTRSFAHARV